MLQLLRVDYCELSELSLDNSYCDPRFGKLAFGSRLCAPASLALEIDHFCPSDVGSLDLFACAPVIMARFGEHRVNVVVARTFDDLPQLDHA